MKRITYSILYFIIGTFILVSCNKKEEDKRPDVSDSSSKQTDQAGSSAADMALEDINDIISNKIGGGSSSNSRTAAYNLPCGVVSIDSSVTNSEGSKVYSVKYGESTPCGYKRKGGEVEFELSHGAAFNEKGAVYSVRFNNYSVEVLATGNTVTLNGIINVTNSSGGYIWHSITRADTIKHKIRGSFNVTYDNNEVRPRNYFQSRKWLSNGSWAGLTFTVSGDSIVNDSTIISETGRTLENNYEFQTAIKSPFKWRNCGSTYAGPYRLTEGKAVMNVEVPGISPANFIVEAGFYYDYNNSQSVPKHVGTCESNAYKVTIEIGTALSSQYQLY